MDPLRYHAFVAARLAGARLCAQKAPAANKQEAGEKK